MLVDNKSLNGVIDADIVVIGAGTAGLYLARDLAARGRSVTLIEAGGRIANSAPNRETSVRLGRAHRGIFDGRGVGLGGTSTLWGGQLVEFDPADFNRGYAPWPLTLADLEPWYARVYDTLGLSGRQPAEAYRAAVGGETGGAVAEANDVERFFTLWLPEPNFARLFRADLLHNPRICILLDTTVNGFRFDGSRLAAVNARQDGRDMTITGNEFVLATGTIAANRLMLSAQRQGAVPWRDRAGIGTAFQDHLAGRAAGVELIDEAKFRNFFENARVGGIKLQPKLRLSEAARARGGPEQLGIAGAFGFQSDLSEHIANIKHFVRALRSAAGLSLVTQLPRDLAAVGRSFAPFILRYLRDRRVMAFFDNALDFNVQCEQRPIACSRIVLTGDEPAADGLFRAGVDWRVDGREIGGIRDFVTAADGWLQDRGIARLVVDPRIADADPAFIDAALSDNNHPCGGLPMQADPADGVVDTDLRVRGTENLHIASAAVYPSSSHANCTLTLLALTARLADRLIAREGRS